MDALEAIKTRRSVRKFLNKPVEPEKLQAILEATRMAPSWANMQCWRFVVVQDLQVKVQISELSYVEAYFATRGYKTNPSQKALAQAPVRIVGLFPLGYPEEGGKAGPPRKPLDEIVYHGRWKG
jgi:nitroreductase